MRIVILAILALSAAVLSRAQNPVTWSFRSKKIAERTFEIRIRAEVQAPWHIYSQFTPEGGPVPTKILFTKNPLVVLHGGVKEKGKLVQKREEVFGIDVKFFDGFVEFVQIVKLKSAAKTRQNGTVEFMACNDEQCLPPATLPFSVMLQ